MTYILETIITLKSMVQSQNYCIWYLESGAGNLINNEAYFEQKNLLQVMNLPFPWKLGHPPI